MYTVLEESCDYYNHTIKIITTTNIKDISYRFDVDVEEHIWDGSQECIVELSDKEVYEKIVSKNKDSVIKYKNKDKNKNLIAVSVCESDEGTYRKDFSISRDIAFL